MDKENTKAIAAAMREIDSLQTKLNGIARNLIMMESGAEAASVREAVAHLELAGGELRFMTEMQKGRSA